MKKIIKNKKGFTLIELLAVIVLLAIVGVVGANLIITRLNKGKVDTFVNDYRDIVKEVSAAQIDGLETCDKTSCPNKIDYSSNDIDLTVTIDGNMTTTVTVAASSTGTFKKVDLSKYYCNPTGSDTDCKDKTKLPKGAKLSGKQTIIGTFE